VRSFVVLCGERVRAFEHVFEVRRVVADDVGAVVAVDEPNPAAIDVADVDAPGVGDFWSAGIRFVEEQIVLVGREERGQDVLRRA